MGIGFACAELFREEGARVAITGRSEANLTAAKDALVPVRALMLNLSWFEVGVPDRVPVSFLG